jgi:Domain of unknown function (DUF4440)
MKRAAYLLVSVLTVTAAILTTAHPHAHNDDSAALFVLENRWIQALRSSDTDFLSELFAKDFVDTDETGHRSNKVALLGALKSGALKLRKLQVSDMKAYVYGSAAVVIGASTQDGAYEGNPLAPKIVFTDTFIRSGSAWKAVASHRTESK